MIFFKIKSNNILSIIRTFYERLPKFHDGRIDYSNSDIAAVIIVFVRYKHKILLLKRSDKVRAYKNKWNSVAGYLDELKPIDEKVLEELHEELNINKNSISSMKVGKFYKFTDKKIKKTWIVNPVMVELKDKPKITLNWEHTEFLWIYPSKIKNYNIVP